MRTVKELSDLTGISVRTLHYYDQIGLLTPTAKSEAGYRLYDDRALETLQQILFFREFDLPLKRIKSIMDDPALDQKQILQMQRDMLVAQRTHRASDCRYRRYFERREQNGFCNFQQNGNRGNV